MGMGNGSTARWQAMQADVLAATLLRCLRVLERSVTEAPAVVRDVAGLAVVYALRRRIEAEAPR